MSQIATIETRPEVCAALDEHRPVVALESTLIAHGLPWPINLKTACAAEDAIRAAGATPATIAVLAGRPCVGILPSEIEMLAREKNVLKASRRDLAHAIAMGRTAATTVAATMHLAHLASIRVFATGGIGGVHRPAESWDVSADLIELSRTPVAVVCAGAKNILDLPRTLEFLETHGVPVIGFGVDEFPAFYVRSSGLRLPARVETPKEAAAIMHAHWALAGAGVVLAQPISESEALSSIEFENALTQAQTMADKARICGAALTPFLLARIAEITAGKTLRANQSLIVANARLAAHVATALAE